MFFYIPYFHFLSLYNAIFYHAYLQNFDFLNTHKSEPHRSKTNRIFTRGGGVEEKSSKDVKKNNRFGPPPPTYTAYTPACTRPAHYGHLPAHVVVLDDDDDDHGIGDGGHQEQRHVHADEQYAGHLGQPHLTGRELGDHLLDDGRVSARPRRRVRAPRHAVVARRVVEHAGGGGRVRATSARHRRGRRIRDGRAPSARQNGPKIRGGTARKGDAFRT